MDKFYEKETQEFIDFIYDNPSTYHVVKDLGNRLEKEGFIQLEEDKPFKIEKGKSYFVSRNGTALIAFKVPKADFNSYSLVSAHTDSPCFKIKQNPELCGDYTTLNVETYGGLLLSPWFDRPLSIAGRVLVENEGKVETRLLAFDKDLVQIVSLAIHQNRTANDGIKYNVQKELMPLLGLGSNPGALKQLISEKLGISKDSILDYDLFLYARNKGSLWGMDNEFFSCPRIDDLQCAYTAIKALLNSEVNTTFPLCSLFDNEEVGSGTKQGALSDFLTTVLERIEYALNIDIEKHCQLKANSLMLSADNAHSKHPNYPEMCDITNKTLPNGGIVIKYSSNQKYATDGYSASLLKVLLEKNNIPYQVFFNNSNLPGGSTLGNLSMQKYSLNTVDIGASQLAMHSVYETAGTKDTYYFIKAFEAFYSR